MRWIDAQVSGRDIILEGSPWSLGDSFYYFPASLFLVYWKDKGNNFSYHYDEMTSEMNPDSFLKEEEFKALLTIYDMTDKVRCLYGLQHLQKESFREGNEKIKNDFRRLIT
jgi:hypothetical protein